MLDAGAQPPGYRLVAATFLQELPYLGGRRVLDVRARPADVLDPLEGWFPLDGFADAGCGQEPLGLAVQVGDEFGGQQDDGFRVAVTLVAVEVERRREVPGMAAGEQFSQVDCGDLFLTWPERVPDVVAVVAPRLMVEGGRSEQGSPPCVVDR